MPDCSKTLILTFPKEPKKSRKKPTKQLQPITAIIETSKTISVRELQDRATILVKPIELLQLSLYLREEIARLIKPPRKPRRRRQVIANETSLTANEANLIDLGLGEANATNQVSNNLRQVLTKDNNKAFSVEVEVQKDRSKVHYLERRLYYAN